MGNERYPTVTILFGNFRNRDFQGVEMASSQSQVRFRSSTIHRIVLLAVSLFLLYCLNIEMLYQVYNSPGGDYKLEVRYNFYTIFLYGFAQARPGIVYLKRNDGTIIHKAKISEVGELSDNLITWHDDYVWIYLDKWYYSKSKKNMGSYHQYVL